MRDDWVRSQDRKRQAVAYSWTLGLYGLALAGAWALGLLDPSLRSFDSPAIIINFEESDAGEGKAILGLTKAPDAPEPAPPAPIAQVIKPEERVPVPTPPAPRPAAVKPAPAKPAAAAPAPAKPAATAPAAAAPAAAAASASSAAPTPQPNPASPPAEAPSPAVASAAPTAAPAAEAPPPAVASAAPTTAPAAEAPAPAAEWQPAPDVAAAAVTTQFGSAPVVSTGPEGVTGGFGTVSYKGQEKGNTLDTTLGAGVGSAGRNLYVEIYLFMPLPLSVPQAIYEKIPADRDNYYSSASRKLTFQKYYERSGAAWKLRQQPSFAERGPLWIMLEDAGYDIASADYKAGRRLNPVVIEFTVSPAAPGARPKIVDLNVISSSGSREIDDAVIEGFKRASFFNKTGNAVSGSFTYRFEGAPK